MDLEQYNRELEDLFVELCKISSPTDHEDEKAAFITNWYADNGLMDFELDSCGNVIYFFGLKAYNPIHLFVAHMDTVFPMTTELKPEIKDDVLYCPGAGDNTVNLAIMMMTVKYLAENDFNPKCCVAFAADIGEEGLGNLKGIRNIFGDYGIRIEEVIALDLSYGTLINKAVGSRRFKINIHSKGGHAYYDFGNTNSIAVAAEFINKLYVQEVKDKLETTYNVGVINGGTGVNVIASSAEFIYEIRSTNGEALDKLNDYLNNLVDSYKEKGINIECEQIGDRPCNGKVDEVKMKNLENRVVEVLKSDIWTEAGYPTTLAVVPGSTDINISLSKGIPSLCVGLAFSDGHHSLDEYVRLDSLAPGLKTLIELARRAGE